MSEHRVLLVESPCRLGMDLKRSFESAVRLELAGVVADEVELTEGRHRLPAAVAATVASLCRSLTAASPVLTLPLYPCRSMAGA